MRCLQASRLDSTTRCPESIYPDLDLSHPPTVQSARLPTSVQRGGCATNLMTLVARQRNWDLICSEDCLAT
jgi:hypothetical protein